LWYLAVLFLEWKNVSDKISREIKKKKRSNLCSITFFPKIIYFMR
jgi:hypothetical protein